MMEEKGVDMEAMTMIFSGIASMAVIEHCYGFHHQHGFEWRISCFADRC